MYLIENQIHHHQVESNDTSQHHKTLKKHIISNKTIMPKATIKRKEVNGKSDEEGTTCRGRFPHGTTAAELPVVPLVVMPEAVLRARVSTPSSIESLSQKLLSQLASPSSNLSTAFYDELRACIKKSTSSAIKKKPEYIDFCDSAQVKSECLKYTKTAAEVPIDQQTHISFLLRKFNKSGITTAFSMLIKVAGASPMAFFPIAIKERRFDSTILMLDL